MSSRSSFSSASKAATYEHKRAKETIKKGRYTVLTGFLPKNQRE